MRDQQRNREQYRWAGWAVGLAAVGLAIAGYGCGDDGRGAGDSDGAAYPEPSYTAVTDARTVATDMDADHSAAWMEALDGLGLSSGIPDGRGLDVGGDGVGAVAEVTLTVYVAPPQAPPTPYAVLDTSVQLTEAQMVDLLRQAGFDEYTWPAALAVSFCESRWSPNATGGASEKGLFQIHPIHYDSSYDPLANVRAAYRISSAGYDWSAWSCKPW